MTTRTHFDSKNIRDEIFNIYRQYKSATLIFSLNAFIRPYHEKKNEKTKKKKKKNTIRYTNSTSVIRFSLQTIILFTIQVYYIV